ncbi:MAG: hypothetical protein V4548_12995 [Bacteroidota bacterium]
MTMKNVLQVSLRRMIIILSCIITLCSCSSNRKVGLSENKDDSNLTEIKVLKIESFKNYYFIYGKGTQNDVGYKIVSAMHSNSVVKIHSKKNEINRIEIGKIYKLRLTWISEPNLEDKNGSLLFQRCITRYPLVQICTEAGFELYQSNDIDGLEIKKKSGGLRREIKVGK